MKHFLVFVFIFILNSFCSLATHLKGGEITYKSIDRSTRTYSIKLTIYRDVQGVDQPNATLNFGDGTACDIVDLSRRIQVEPDTEILNFFFTHSFPADGSYIISFNEENRNENINNINDGNSVQISFYIESKIVIDAFTPNDSFIFHERPILEGFTGNDFSHTIAGLDPEGDSLSFEFLTPRAFKEGNGCETGTAFEVPNYKFPNHPNFYEGSDIPQELSINPFSGNIIWNQPGKTGEYSIAVKVSEFRNGRLVGYSVRDFQIVITESDYYIEIEKVDTVKLKEFNVIDLEEGEPLELKVRLKNSPLYINLKLEAYSELLIDENAAFETYDSADYKLGKFSFEFDSTLIRDNPYIITFMGSLINPIGVSRKDLTYILNPQKGKIFNYKTEPGVPPVDPTGTDPEIFYQAIPAFPNPTKESFFVNTSLFRKPVILLYNTTGKIIKSQRLNSEERAEIKVEELKPGIYYYQVHSSGKKQGTGKVVVE
ncbi:MAG TPA: T9SS type A sorting domain-containing protein [Cytophagales bacterium]|nr:T9SS type A sorting domain-containing protein [Cytophagales bacterium]